MPRSSRNAHTNEDNIQYILDRSKDLSMPYSREQAVRALKEGGSKEAAFELLLDGKITNDANGAPPPATQKETIVPSSSLKLQPSNNNAQPMKGNAKSDGQMAVSFHPSVPGSNPSSPSVNTNTNDSLIFLPYMQPLESIHELDNRKSYWSGSNSSPIRYVSKGELDKVSAHNAMVMEHNNMVLQLQVTPSSIAPVAQSLVPRARGDTSLSSNVVATTTNSSKSTKRKTMITTRGDKENESDEHLQNKRNRVSKFTSLKETDLAGVCEDESEDEKPTTKKKQLQDDDDVPEKSRKKKKKKKQRGATKKKNGWRSNSGHENMTTEKRRERTKKQVQDAKAGTKGCGVVTANDKSIVTRVGCAEFRIQLSTVLSDDINIISASPEMGSDFYNSIAIESNAIAQAESDPDGNPLFTGVKVNGNKKEDFSVAPRSREELEAMTRIEVVEQCEGSGVPCGGGVSKATLIDRYLEPTISPDETSLRKASTLWGYDDASRHTPESNMYRKINEREDDIHPHVNNPKANAGLQVYNDQHYTTKPHIFWIKNMTMDNVVDFFPNGGGSLTDYLKGSGDYNMKWINSHEKKVTKDLLVSALLLEHYKPSGYIDNIEKMNSETLASIMKK